MREQNVKNQMRVAGMPVTVTEHTVYYIVIPIPYLIHFKALKALDDIRLYEVSPCVSGLGLLVGGKNQEDACQNAHDLLILAGVVNTYNISPAKKEVQNPERWDGLS